MNKREQRTRLIPKSAALVAAVALSMGLTHAEVMMITPVDATAQSSLAGYPATKVIDGSGMTPSSPVTAASTAGTVVTDMWLSGNTTSTWITFDLGAVQTLTGFHLWNFNQVAGSGSASKRGIQTAGIYVGTAMPTNGMPYAEAGPDWVGGTLVANMTFALHTSSASYTGEDYFFANTVTGRYIQVYVTSNYGYDAYTGISEIRFYPDTARSSSDQFISPATATAGGSYVYRQPAAAVDGSGMTPNAPVRITSTASTTANYTMWLNSSTNKTWITFDLGALQKITGFRLWNYNEANGTQYGVKNASLYVGNTLPANGMDYASVGPAWGTLIEEFGFQQANGSTTYAGVDYALTTAVVGRYIQLYITGSFSGNMVGLSEIAFYTSTRYEAISPLDATAQSSFSDQGGSYSATRVIDGSGMMPKSPVTAASTANTDVRDMWLSDGTTNTWITFDLGAVQSLSGFHLWNFNQFSGGSTSQRGIQTAGIYVGTALPDNGTPYAEAGPNWEGGTLVTNMTFALHTSSASYTGEDYLFANTVNGRYIQVYVTSQFGFTDAYTGLSEIMFYTPMRDLTRLNSGNGVIENRATESVRVIEGTGDARALTLDAAITTNNTLYVAATEAPVNVDLAGQMLALTKIQTQADAGGLTLGSGSEKGILKSNYSNLLVDNQSTNSVTINSVIANGSGASSLTKTGRGTLILTGANTYSGNTTVNGSTLSLAGGSLNNSAINLNASTLQMASGSINSPAINLNASTLQMADGSSVTVGQVALNMGMASFLSFDGSTLVARSGASALDWIGAGNSLRIANSGAVIGTANASVAINRPLLQEGASGGGLTKTGANTLTLTAPCTYAGATEVQGGTLKLAPPAPLIHYDFDSANITGTTVKNLGIGGTAFNGVINGSPATNVAGVAGQAVTFSATGQGIVTAGSVSLVNGFTFAAWLKSDGSSDAGRGRRIISNDNINGGYLGTSGSDFFLTIIKNNFSPVSMQASNDTANWHHIAMSWNGSKVILYYDGAPIQTNALANVNAAYASKIGFGNRSTPVDDYWNGSMDEAYVFDRALTAAELAALKNLSLADVAPLPVTTDLKLNNNATLELDGVTQTVATLTLNGVLKARGNCTWGAPGSGAEYTSPQFIGTGVLRVVGPPAQGTVILVH